jgi:putative sigma-54 modulation protein
MNLRLIDGKMPTSDALSEHMTEKFTSLLSPYADRLGDVEVRIADENGPKGGVDKSCSVLAYVNGKSPINVRVEHEDFYGAIDQAASKVKRAVSHALDRDKR